MMPLDSGNQTAFQVVLYLGLVAACLLARHNFRARKVDQRGAVRICAWYFVCAAASLFLNMHHSLTAQEVSGF